MKKEIKKLAGSKVEIIVEVSAEEFKQKKSEVLKELAQEAQLPGFRKGKTPKDLVIKKIGEERILTETAQKTIEDSFRKIILEQGLEPITQPQVQITKLSMGSPFSYKAFFVTLPEVELPDYKKIASNVKKQEVEVKKEEIEETLNFLQKARPNLKKVLRPAKKGDWVEISFSSPELGSGKKHEDSFILGKGQLVPGFKEQLLGMSAGEEKQFSLVLPQNFRIEPLRGKEAHFKVKMKEVKETEPKEINDEFAKELGEFETLDDLKKSIKEGLVQEKEQAEKQKTRSEIIERVVKNSKLEIPEVLVEKEKERQFTQLKQRIKKELGISFEQYLKKIDKNEKEVRKALAKEAGARAKRFLVLREIARQEDVKVDEKEVENEVNKVLSQFQGVKQAEDNIDLNQLKSYTRDRIRNEKVLKVLEDF